MIELKIKSVLVPYIESFRKECLLTRRSMNAVDCNLKSFDKFLVSKNVSTPNISHELFDEWVNTFRATCSEQTTYVKRSCIISLLEYMRAIGIQCDVPRKGAYKPSNFVPYIFTEDEILKIFATCDNWRDKSLKPESALMAMPVFLRLIYSTALRVGEAINILNKDVNLKNRTIRITKTKNGSERIAPINDSLLTCLEQYIEYRNLLPEEGIDAPDSHFLVNHTGRPLDQTTVLSRFHKITKEAGIQGNNPKSGCRIHDLRHTACVHVMMKLVRSGYDLYNCLPAISAFMGHLSIFSTEKYLRFTREMFPEMLGMTTTVTQSINNIINEAYNINDDE